MASLCVRFVVRLHAQYNKQDKVNSVLFNVMGLCPVGFCPTEYVSREILSRFGY